MKQLIQLKNKLHDTSLKVATAILVFISRLGVLPANLSPLGSFGFFGSNLLYYFSSIIIFDLLVGGLYKGAWITYIGFAAYPVIGGLARRAARKINSEVWPIQIALLPVASLVFFFVSNLGVWWYWYDHTWTSFLLCYTLALPFYRKTLMGDLAFGYGYCLIKNHHSVAQLLTITKTKFQSHWNQVTHPVA